jgi:hypothetical protein
VPDKDAVMVAVSVDASPTVFKVKLAVVAPAGTVTVAGKVTSAVVEDRLIVEPPFGAARLSVTVPVAVEPPITEFGEMAIPANNGL